MGNVAYNWIWPDFQTHLRRYFVDKDESAKEQIDRLRTLGNLEQLKKMQRVFTMAEQVNPAVQEILPYVTNAFRTHEFFVNFWRISIPYKTGRNLNELMLWAIATKHCVAIEQTNNRKRPFEVCLKVYPSRKPYYVDNTK
jgi:hypothetical protein